MIDTSFLTGTPAPATPLLDPLTIQARKIAVRNALAAGALQDQQIQAGVLANKQAQASYDQNQQFRALFNNGMTPAAAPAAPAPAPAPAMAPAPDVSAGVPPGGAALPAAPAFDPSAAAATAPPAGPAPVANAPQTAAHDIPDSQILGIFGQAGYSLIHARNEANKLAGEAQAAADAHTKAVNDYWGSAAYGLAGVNYDQGAVQAAIQKAQADHMDKTPQFQQFAANANNPAALKQLGSIAMSQSGEQQKLLNERTTASSAASNAQLGRDRLNAELPGLQADNTLKTLTAAGNAPIQPKDQKELDLRAQEIAKLNTEAELADKASKGDVLAKRALDMLAETRRASQPQINITPGGYGVLQQQYATSGVLPSFNRGPGGQVQANVVNQMGANTPAFNPAAAKADFKANSDSLAAMQKQRDAVVTFEKTAGANLDLFLKQAAKIPDSGVPWINTPLRMVDDKLAGSPNIAAVNAARQVANNEIAKVTSNPTLGGALSDSARHEVEAFNPQNATFKQTLAVAKILRQDMENRKTFYDQGISEIKSRIAPAAPSPSSSATKPDYVFHPDTGLQKVP